MFDSRVCGKCGSKMNVSLQFCTLCGEPLSKSSPNSAPSPGLSHSGIAPVSKAGTGSIAPKVFIGCTGILFGCLFLFGVGFLAYALFLKPSQPVYESPDHFGRIVVPKEPTVRFVTEDRFPKTLDPQMDVFGQAILLNSLFDGLLDYKGEEPDLVPSLAERWESNADSTVWTFYLRSDAQWTDGKPVTADDLVFSWRRVLDPATGSKMAFLLHLVKNGKQFNGGSGNAEELGLSAIDPRTFEVTLEEPAPYFYKLVVQPAFRPVPRHVVERHGDDWTKPANFVGSGAFRLSRVNDDKEIVVERNTTFWDSANVSLERLTFIARQFQEDDEPRKPTSAEQYESGSVDAAFVIHDNSYLEKKDYKFIRRNAVNFLTINTTKKPLDDVRVRRALSLAIDRNKLSEVSTFPWATFIPPIDGYENVPGSGYYPDLARKLMAEAGFPNGSGFPDLTYIYNTSARNRDYALNISDQWKKELGIKTKLINLDWKVFLEQRRKPDEWGVAIGGWIGDYRDPHAFFTTFAEPYGFGTGWSDKNFSRILEETNLERDPARRYKSLAKVESYLLDQQPIVPISVSRFSIFSKPYLKGLVLNSLGYINWRDVSVDTGFTLEN